MLLEGAFCAHLYTEAETNNNANPLDPAVIAANADKAQLWYKCAFTNNLKTDNVDSPTDEDYDQFTLLKKKYIDMADDYAFGILIEPEGRKGVNKGYQRPATQPGLRRRRVLHQIHQEETHKLVMLKLALSLEGRVRG